MPFHSCCHLAVYPKLVRSLVKILAALLLHFWFFYFEQEAISLEQDWVVVVCALILAALRRQKQVELGAFYKESSRKVRVVT